MYTQEQIEQHIWDYIDGFSSTDEKQMVERLLQSDQQWIAVYRELKGLNGLIGETDLLEQPSMRFSKNVMEEVAKYKIAPATKSYINKKIIYGIAAFFILSIIGFLIYGISFIDMTKPGSGNIPDMNLNKLNVDWSKYLNSTMLNIFLLLDVVAGLMLLDRYLRRKKEENVQA
jgi:hypothetical protein